MVEDNRTKIKQAMFIGSGTNSIITTEGFGFSAEYDLDNLGGVMNFSPDYRARVRAIGKKADKVKDWK